MARRNKKGRPISGWVIVDKPAGIGSTTMTSHIRWAFGAQKAGHAGTLDPDATGVLAVALGEATKTIPCIAEALKCYHFRVIFGARTSSDDASGEVLERNAHRPSPREINAALAQFEGQIMQVPPQVSACKVDGERAYDLAREGAEFELEARPLWVESLTYDTSAPESSEPTEHADLQMVCGKGGYVRAIARDLGEALGCLGHVGALRRVWSGPFHVQNALASAHFEAPLEAREAEALLLPLEASLVDLPHFEAASESARTRLRNGNPGEVIPQGSEQAEWGDLAWVSFRGRPLALGRYQGGTLHPERVFNLSEPPP